MKKSFIYMVIHSFIERQLSLSVVLFNFPDKKKIASRPVNALKGLQCIIG